MRDEENEKTKELPEGDVSVQAEDLPRSDQFPDSSELSVLNVTKC